MEIKIGATYQHFRGGMYKVLGLGKHSETLEELVVYQHLDGEKEIWARPIKMFFGEVEKDGQKFTRFKYIEG